ncbi:hypothetical protein [Corynebacterium sp. HMSC034A01]|uniref:hypothetical protein n=1 Tax=Corynebacterium sp. HMSC034A01 TaxID=1739295 RepID=UPI0008A91A0A|nr:hypothetical protein [Corynebacterium sp. HMSC034A01]OHR24114.1 hypothetical protein HMPREF2791_05010 [Corynebacterium sp. HMSC034A01]
MHSRTAPRLAAALAAAFLACAPTASAADLRVDLRESVGADWFARIGDRDVELLLIDDLRPTPDNLQSLDIPAITRDHPDRLRKVDTKASKEGTATFTGLSTGVYLVRVADNPDTQDARVSYAPFVVAVTPDKPAQVVAPKAQELGISVDPLTACNTLEWKEAAAPGTYVEYDFVSTVPNLSTDGTLNQYVLTLEFSRGHTVQWDNGGPRSVVAQGDQVLRFDAAAATPSKQVPGTARKEQPVNKLQAPRLTIHGAGKSTELKRGEDYDEQQQGNDEATFTLTSAGLAKLARAKSADPATTVETWVPAKANDKKPWGSGPVRDATLGDLATTATLTADGMDATRAPVTVEHVNHINVVERRKCFDAAAATTTVTDDDQRSTETETETRTPTSAMPSDASVTEVVTRETTRADGSPATVTETVVKRGEGDGTPSIGERVGDLASTGASVIGITGLAVLLILLGLFLRRRNDNEEE